MKHLWMGLAAGGLAMAAPSMADVKAGVDAWQQGDYERAVREWRPLADAGDPDAQFNMGQAYKLGRGVTADLAAATEWYRRAAVQGHERAQDSYGLLLFQGGQRDEAMPWLQKSASRGEPRAQYLLGTALFNGEFIGKDWVRAYALMSRAAAAGLPQARTSLTEMDKYVSADDKQKALAMAGSLAVPPQTGRIAMAQTAPAKAGAGPVAAPPSQPAPKAVGKVAAAKSVPVKTEKPESKADTPKAGSHAAARPAPKPTPTPPKSGDWRVQLGAFSDEGRARTEWKTLTGKVGGLSSHQYYLEKAGKVTRLQAGPLASDADAARLCRSVRAAGGDCLIKKI